MRFVDVRQPGNHYQLTLSHASPPVCGAHDVVIRVHASGVNRADLFQAEGRYAPPEGSSSVLGLEVSGVITDIGGEVKSLQAGEEVCAILSGGGYAEYVCVPEWRVLSVPRGITLEQAAGLPEAYFTVFHTLFNLGGLAPGERLLAHGGSSGIGATAIQLAKAFGAEVITTAGSAEKCAFCEALGADMAVNYKEQDFVQAIEKRYDGVDVALDMVGGSYADKHLKLLKRQGRLIQIALLEGSRAEINLARLLMKNLTVAGFTLRSQTEGFFYELAQSVRSLVWPLLESGAVKPVVDSVFPAEQAMEAHDRMRSSAHMGKILLRWD